MSGSGLKIVEGGLEDPRVAALIAHHFTTARAQTDEESAHALDLDGLRAPDIRFWTVWNGDRLAGFGALKALSPTHGEIKSMHTVEALRGSGVGSAVLQQIIAAARAGGFHRLSLETGSMAFFAPARALYEKHGFAECPPFADYRPDPNSVYMSLALD